MTLPAEMGLREDDLPVTTEAILRQLVELREMRRAFDRIEVMLFTLLRRRGVKWEVIAEGLGLTSRQGATSRYQDAWKRAREELTSADDIEDLGQ